MRRIPWPEIQKQGLNWINLVLVNSFRSKIDSPTYLEFRLQVYFEFRWFEIELNVISFGLYLKLHKFEIQHT